MNRFIVRATLVAMLGGVSGCSTLFGPEGYFRDRGDDYLYADVIDPMVLPPGVTEESVQQLYMIPNIQNNDVDTSGAFVVPRPQSLSDNAFTDKVKIQKLGNRAWILVSAPPAAVWPQVRSFLSRNNLEVAYTDATSGIIETGWLRFQEDEAHKDKYRLQIEQGVQPDSTEIHIRHVSVGRDVPGSGQINWPEQSADKERESWMMDELAATIASDASSSQAASLLAQTIGLSDKVTVKTDGEEPMLLLGLEYSRAWATVGFALQKDGFKLWDNDDEVGIFYVNYKPETGEEEEPGFLARWFGGSKDEAPDQSPYTLAQVLGNLQLDNDQDRKIFGELNNTSTDRLTNVPGYLVVMRGRDENIHVRIRDAEGRQLPAREARKLLNTIRNNLI